MPRFPSFLTSLCGASRHVSDDEDRDHSQDEELEDIAHIVLVSQLQTFNI